MADIASFRQTHWIIKTFAVIGSLGVLAVVTVVIFLAVLLFVGQRRPPPAVVDRSGNVVFVVGGVDALQGTDLIEMRIFASQESRGSYSSAANETRNILLFDKRSGASWRLLPDNASTVHDVTFLPDGNDPALQDGGMAGVENEKTAPARYYVLTVDRSEDAAGKDLIVGTLATRRQATLMRSIDGIDQMWMQTPTRVGMIVRQGRTLYYRVVDMSELKVVGSTKIAVD